MRPNTNAGEDSFALIGNKIIKKYLAQIKAKIEPGGGSLNHWKLFSSLLEFEDTGKKKEKGKQAAYEILTDIGARKSKTRVFQKEKLGTSPLI